MFISNRIGDSLPQSTQPGLVFRWLQPSLLLSGHRSDHLEETHGENHRLCQLKWGEHLGENMGENMGENASNFNVSSLRIWKLAEWTDPNQLAICSICVVNRPMLDNSGVPNVNIDHGFLLGYPNLNSGKWCTVWNSLQQITFPNKRVVIPMALSP